MFGTFLRIGMTVHTFHSFVISDNSKVQLKICERRKINAEIVCLTKFSGNIFRCLNDFEWLIEFNSVMLYFQKFSHIITGFNSWLKVLMILEFFIHIFKI